MTPTLKLISSAVVASRMTPAMTNGVVTKATRCSISSRVSNAR